jgi:hypothetical protein
LKLLPTGGVTSSIRVKSERELAVPLPQGLSVAATKARPCEVVVGRAIGVPLAAEPGTRQVGDS